MIYASMALWVLAGAAYFALSRLRVRANPQRYTPVWWDGPDLERCLPCPVLMLIVVGLILLGALTGMSSPHCWLMTPMLVWLLPGWFVLRQHNQGVRRQP